MKYSNNFTIIEIKFGAHLYGTTTSSSDLDIKGVFLPPARDILLQRIRPMISATRSKKHGEKNTKEDIDKEFYSLSHYLNLIAQCQIVALDMLYAPKWAAITTPHPLWNDIKKLAPKILTKGSGSFVKYCRKQANKYGIKGSRIAASRTASDLLQKAEKKYGHQEKLISIYHDLKKIVADNELLTFYTDNVQPNTTSIIYFEVCGKKIPLTATIKNAREISQHIVNNYGQRALAAEKNEGIDWKALSHAIRVGHEALEFFSSNHITFPRPEAKHLIKIKQGKLPYKEVSHEIEQLLIDVEEAEKKSILPTKINQKIIDDFVENIYRERIKNKI